MPFLSGNLVPILLAASGIYLGALVQFPLPGTDIPQTAQTIAILCTSALLSNYRAPIAVTVYLLAGLAGLPVFSDGNSGVEHLIGDSAGYFMGFLVASAIIAWWSRNGSTKKLLSGFITMLAGHAIILLFGFLWLAINYGLTSAYETGIAPFYYGSLAKSVICSLLLVSVYRLSNEKPAAARKISG